MKNIRRCACIFMIFSLYCYLSTLADNSQVPPINNNLENISNSENDDEIISDDGDVDKNNNNQIVNDLEPSVDVHASFDEEISEDAEIFNKQIYGDGTSQNSGIVNEMTNNGPPVVVTLVDVATTELQQKAAILPSQNDNTVSTTITTNNTDTQQINQTQLEINEKETVIVDEQLSKENKTIEEEIPSFSEWTQKRLEEAEKQKEPQNTSSHHHQQQQQQNNYNQQQQQQQSNDSTGGGLNSKQSSGGKLRWKNYASPDCGAKVVASNPEAVSPSAILSPSRDEYKLNKCTNRIWFIVELCEAIQAKKIDLANFELFSSSPKDFIVSVSDRFPTRDWINVGNFQAKDERDIQSFDLNPQLFSKYIKVEVKSHYGSEHYCPMSLFRVYGTSEFEVLQKEDVQTNRLEDHDDDDDDGDDEMLDSNFGDDETKNLFSSATDAVLSMVKKAAQVVVGNKGNNSNQIENETTTITTKTTKYVPLINTCSSPSHLVVCDNCSDTLFGKIFELLSCSNLKIKNLVSIPFIQKSLIHSSICQKFGFNFQKSIENNSKSKLIDSFFPSRFLGAMCNYLAISENKVVFNTSNQFTNDTKTKNSDEIVNIVETSEPKILLNNNEPTDKLNLETNIIGGSKVTCSTDTTYTTQIRPTKTITTDLNLNEIPTQSIFETHTDDSQEIDRITDDVSEEKQQEITNDKEHNVTEGGENFENLENFISELNSENHTTNTQTTTTTTTSTPQTQNESVFLRLLNRIKALERNMSLSSQYLEELSKRYKKQVEEMQKTLDKTVSTMTEELKKKDEYNRKLEENLLTLTLAVENLIAEKNSWSSLISYITFIFLLIFFITTIFKRKPNTIIDKNQDNDVKLNIKRRKSIDVIQHHIPQKRRRRPSDQALKIVHLSSTIETSKRKKRKKLKRSTSVGTISDLTKTTGTTAAQKIDWIETEAKRIDEIPFVVLEDSEHSTLEPINLNSDNDEKLSNSIKTGELSMMNGEIYKKSASFDGTVVHNNNQQHGINGNVVVVNTTPKKEKKSLKKILKKVF